MLIVSEDRMLGSIQYIYAFTALVLLLTIFPVTAIFMLISRKRKEAELLDREVHAAAEIYDAMYLIDATTGVIRPLRMDEEIERCLEGDYAQCRGKLSRVASQMAEEGYRDVVASFLDLSTLEERMDALRSVSQEYLDRSKRWMRMRFVAVTRDPKGRLNEILWALESIDEDKRRQEHLMKLAETDGLTETRNRRSGEAMIRQLLADGKNGMFLLLDVDRFKSINDEYGHTAGDKVLVAVASALGSSMRKSDVIFRLGGDEFAAFAPGLQSEQTGKRIVDSILHRVEGLRIEELRDRHVHVSIGITFSSADRQDSFEAIYQRADAGMYDSKQRGGNCATFQ